ncbi:tyrosine-type recombinase/integrase [Actinoplanes flavus]|nr:site-specific integrase [Actinoplanes flavus]
MSAADATGSHQESTNIALVTALMAQLNVTAEQITNGASSSPRKPAPTFAEFIPHVVDAVTPGTRRAYSTYWQRILEQWGHRRLDEPTPTEIQQFAQRTRESAARRRNSRGGGAAAEHLIAALRCIYHYARNDRLIDADDNPAARVRKPRRQRSLREALPERAVAQIITVASETGNDPDLDLLILRFHLETACRQGGALQARRRDLDTEQCLILLREKGQTERWQPISPTLAAALATHFSERGDGNPASQILRYRNGRPVGKRRYDNLWNRIRSYLPWADSHQVSAHWLRHTTLTWVERHFGQSIAHRYAGHADPSRQATISVYTKATLREVAQALAALTGEPHPLADGDPMTVMLTARLGEQAQLPAATGDEPDGTPHS